jgi:hypothetical protein
MTCLSFGILSPYQTFGQLRSAVELRPIELSSRQAFDTLQIDIRQIGAVQLC